MKWEPDDKEEAEPGEARYLSWGPQPGLGGTGFAPRPSDSRELLSAPGSGAVGYKGPRSHVLCTLAQTWNCSAPQLSYQREGPRPVPGLLGGAVSGRPYAGSSKQPGLEGRASLFLLLPPEGAF